MSRFSDDNFTITSSSPLLHLCCDAKQRTCGFVLKLPQNTSTHHRFNRKGQVCRYKSSSHRTSAFHHLKTTTASLSAVLVLLSLLLSRFGADGARQALRYNYPRDEVNFSLSQEEYSQVSQEEDSSSTSARLLPEFVGQVPNVTVQVGREARLPCIIRNLATYRAAWIRDEEKNILTLQRQMVTRDPRISLQEESQMDIGNGGADDAAQEANRIRYFVLIIRNVQVEDRGGYMCQINLNPMKAQVGHLRVVVPPDIIDEESSDDVTIVEGANVTLKCRAKGYPQPNIEWRREDGNRVPLGGSRRIMLNKTEGELLDIIRTTRVHSGAWLCIASNGVMPSVSRRILLNVQFAPQIWIPLEEIGAPLGSNITLDCHIEAYPLPLNYWKYGTQTESIYISGPKYEVSVKEKGYKRHLRLTIHRLEASDLGLYYCHAQNSLGRQERQVRVYASETHQQKQSANSKQSISSMTTTTSKDGGKQQGKGKGGKKNRAKLKRKKVVTGGGGDNDNQTENSGGNILYSVINTFRKPLEGGGGTSSSSTSTSSSSSSTSSSSSSKKSSSGDQKSGNTVDEEIEVEDDYEDEGEDDYPHYGANSASSLRSLGSSSSSLMLLFLIVCCSCTVLLLLCPT